MLTSIRNFYPEYMSPFEYYMSPTTLSRWMRIVFQILFQLTATPQWGSQSIMHAALKCLNIFKRQNDSSWEKFPYRDRTYFLVAQWLHRGDRNHFRADYRLLYPERHYSISAHRLRRQTGKNLSPVYRLLRGDGSYIFNAQWLYRGDREYPFWEHRLHYRESTLHNDLITRHSRLRKSKASS